MADDWRMGATVAQNDYQPIDNPWPEEDPFARAAARVRGPYAAVRPGENRLPQTAAGVVGGLAQQVATPGATMARNPYDRDTDTEAYHWFENTRNDNANKWARDAALTMVTAGGAPAAKAGEVVMGSGLHRLRPAPALHPLAEDILKYGNVPQGTNAAWLTRVDPTTGKTVMVNQSGPTGNAFTTLKNTIKPENMTADIRGLPDYKRPDIDMAKLQRENAELIFGPTDRTQGGGFLFGVGGKQFDKPVLLEGGRNFPQMHEGRTIPGMPDDVTPLYASVSKGASSGVNKTASGVLERGGTPYYVPLIMTHGAGDSAKQMATTVHRAMQSANISTDAAAALDKAVRAKNPTATATYPGVHSPELEKWLDTIGLNGRRAFVEGADTAGVLKATGVDVGQLRYANTDPKLRSTPSGSGGTVIGRMRPDVGSTEHPLHTNYASTFMGQRGHVGGLPGNAPFSLLAPDMYRALVPWRNPGGGSLATTPATVAMRGIPGNVPKTQRVTDEVVNNLGEWFRRHPEGWAVPGAAGGMGALASGERETVY